MQSVIALVACILGCSYGAVKPTTTITPTTTATTTTMKPVVVSDITATSCSVSWEKPEWWTPTTVCSMWWKCGGNDWTWNKNWNEVKNTNEWPWKLTGLTPATNCAIMMECTMPKGDKVWSPPTIFSTWSTVAWTTRQTGTAMCCPDGWITMNGSCYWLVREKMTWKKANSTCVEMGAELWMPTTKTEWDMIRWFAMENSWTWLSMETSWDMSWWNWLVKAKGNGKPAGSNWCVAYWGAPVAASGYIHWHTCDSQYWSICQMIS